MSFRWVIRLILLPLDQVRLSFFPISSVLAVVFYLYFDKREVSAFSRNSCQQNLYVYSTKSSNYSFKLMDISV